MVHGTALSMSVTACLLTLQLLDAGMLRSSSSRYCGKGLSNAMSLVCKGWYKRSDPDFPLHNEMEPLQEEMEAAAVAERLFPMFIEHQLAVNMLGGAGADSRYKRGIVEQCCHNPCSVDNLREYCGKAEY